MSVDYVLKRCHELGIDPFVLRGRSRLREHVIARRLIATELRSFGHSYPAIGRALNRDHVTVMYLLCALGRQKPTPTAKRSLRSRRYQDRNKANGLCIKCPKPRVDAQYCRDHASYHAKVMRDRRARVRELSCLGTEEAM